MDEQKEQLLEWFLSKHAYLCDNCDERFFIEKLLPPDQVQCPICGGNVMINSKDAEELRKMHMVN